MSNTQIQVVKPKIEEPTLDDEIKLESPDRDHYVPHSVPNKAASPQPRPVIHMHRKMSAGEKLDELTSLEREIAEMHHVEPPAPAVAQRVSNSIAMDYDEDDTQNEKVMLDMQPPSRINTPVAHDSSMGSADDSKTIAVATYTFEDEDLIAVLKGIDNTPKAAYGEQQSTGLRATTSVPDAEVTDGEGVTIEGEGQFQVIDVVDDDHEDGTSKKDAKTHVITTTIGSYNNANKGFNAVSKLTPEEERAVAMEQMAGLKSRVDRQRRRKQDIKPIQNVENADLVTSLGADWSEDDGDVDKSLKVATKNGSTGVADASIKSAAETMHASSRATASDNVEQKAHTSNKISINKTKVNAVTDADRAKSSPNPNQPQTTGFKRTRIIKRKIIWDPDAPETNFSYAQLLRNGGKPTIDRTKTSPTSAGTIITTVKKEPVKRGRPQTPKEKKPLDSLEKRNQSSSTFTKPLTPKPSTSAVAQSTKTSVAEEVPKPLPPKRRSQTPVANGASSSNTGTKKKKITELDRLMGDEGAANMLNSLESERSKIRVEGNDKSHKPLMRSRAITISERFVTKREVAPTVKKEQVNVPKKRGPKPKASASWDYVYKQQASDESMIIRRRSNSSYSSTASLRRLSLDGSANVKKTAPTAASTSSAASTANAETKVATKNAKVSKVVKSTSEATVLSPSSNKSNNNLEEIASTSASASASASTSASAGASTSASTSSNIKGGKAFEFIKPESKLKQKANRQAKSSPHTTEPLSIDMKKTTTVVKRKARSPAATELKEKTVKTIATVKDIKLEPDVPLTTDVVVQRYSKVVEILFSTHKAKLHYCFTVELMNKLAHTLDNLANDVECNAVVMLTNAAHFCQGIDYTNLLVDSFEQRKHAAKELSTAVKNYLKAIATFPKPIIAGVNGNNIGLGVTQLPLFDVVVASDKGTYETSYTKYGQLPEGLCIWNNLNKIRHNFKTKLFWLCEKLNSSDSVLSGMVNKVTTAAKVNEEAIATAKKIAIMPPESFSIMKKSIISKTENTLTSCMDDEFNIIIQRWTSEDCYQKLKHYIQNKQL